MSDRKLVQIKKNEKPKDLRLLKLQTKLELPMLLLTFVWLATLVIELANGSNVVVSALGTTAWVLFIFYFFLRMAAIQNRVYFFKKNWIFVLAILVSLLRLFPTLQSFPLVRALTATFGMQVIWIFVSVDQGMKSIRRYVGRRGVGYALAFTFVILFAGAAGMMHFESDPTDALGLRTFPRALWWTAMQMTNIGSSYSIKTAGGRTVCLAISIYSAGMFGYLTALFATFFIDRETKISKAEIDRQKSMEGIQEELVQLRRLIESGGLRANGAPPHPKKKLV